MCRIWRKWFRVYLGFSTNVGNLCGFSVTVFDFIVCCSVRVSVEDRDGQKQRLVWKLHPSISVHALKWKVF